MTRLTLTAMVLVALWVGAVPRPGSAQTPASIPASPTPSAGAIGVISGGIDGTYVRIAADLMAVLDDGDRMRVLPILGRGSVQNVADIVGLRGVDVGIVQSDVLAYFRRERLLPGVERKLQYIAKLYDEEVHILARQGIARVQELAGQAVNFDLRGSGTAMTASVLFSELGVSVRPTHDDQATAVEKLKRGEIAGLVFVTGKPARLFSGLGAGAGLHLLPIPLSPALLETYLPARLDHHDYPALVPDGAGVDTVAVGAVMATYSWQPGSERYAQVERFVGALADRFAQFLQPPRHPKWRDVNLTAQVPGWTRFPPAQARLGGAAAPADTVAQSTPPQPPARPARTMRRRVPAPAMQPALGNWGDELPAPGSAVRRPY